MARGPDGQTLNGKGPDPYRRKAPSGGKGRAAADAPTNSNDRFAVLAPTNNKRDSLDSRGSGGSPGGSVADRMRQKDEPPPPPASDEKDGQGARARDEVFAEIRALLDTSAALQLSDFDYRIRQHLHAQLHSGGRSRLHDALTMIQTATAKKGRRDVKNWPAYLAKLVRKFDDDAGQKDREARARMRVENAALCSNAGSSQSSPDSEKKPPVRELSEEEAWLEALADNKDSWLDDLAAATDRNLAEASPPKEASASQESPQRRQAPWRSPPVQPPPPLQPPVQPVVQPLAQPPVQPPTQPWRSPPAQPPAQAPPQPHMQPPTQPPVQPVLRPPTQPPTQPVVQPPMPPPTAFQAPTQAPRRPAPPEERYLPASRQQPPMMPPMAPPQHHHSITTPTSHDATHGTTAASPQQPPMMPPMAPPVLPPAHQPMLPPASSSKQPFMQPASRAPRQPPSGAPPPPSAGPPPPPSQALPATRLLKESAHPPSYAPLVEDVQRQLLEDVQRQQQLQMLEHLQRQQQRGFQARMAEAAGTAAQENAQALDFPIEAWAAWLRGPGQQQQQQQHAGYIAR